MRLSGVWSIEEGYNWHTSLVSGCGLIHTQSWNRDWPSMGAMGSKPKGIAWQFSRAISSGMESASTEKGRKIEMRSWCCMTTCRTSSWTWTWKKKNAQAVFVCLFVCLFEVTGVLSNSTTGMCLNSKHGIHLLCRHLRRYLYYYLSHYHLWGQTHKLRGHVIKWSECCQVPSHAQIPEPPLDSERRGQQIHFIGMSTFTLTFDNMFYIFLAGHYKYRNSAWGLRGRQVCLQMLTTHPLVLPGLLHMDWATSRVQISNVQDEELQWCTAWWQPFHISGGWSAQADGAQGLLCPQFVVAPSPHCSLALRLSVSLCWRPTNTASQQRHWWWAMVNRHLMSLICPNFDPCHVFAHRHYHVLFHSHHALLLPCLLCCWAFLLFCPIYTSILVPITCALGQVGHRSRDGVWCSCLSAQSHLCHRPSATIHVLCW